jgi:hypothetical protein
LIWFWYIIFAMGQKLFGAFRKLSEARKNDRLRVIVFTALAAVTLLFLAAGLSQLELLPGRPLPVILEEERSRGDFQGLPGGDLIILILRVFYFLGLVLLPFFIIYLILIPKAR